MPLTQAQKDRAKIRRARIVEAGRAATKSPSTTDYVTQIQVQVPDEDLEMTYLMYSRFDVYNAVTKAFEAKGAKEAVTLHEIMFQDPRASRPSVRGATWSVFDFSDRVLKRLQWLESKGFVSLYKASTGIKMWLVTPMYGSLTVEEFKDLTKGTDY